VRTSLKRFLHLVRIWSPQPNQFFRFIFCACVFVAFSISLILYFFYSRIQNILLTNLTHPLLIVFRLPSNNNCSSNVPSIVCKKKTFCLVPGGRRFQARVIFSSYCNNAATRVLRRSLSVQHECLQGL